MEFAVKDESIVEESAGAGINNTVTENVDDNYSSVEIKTPTFGFTEPSWRTDFCLVVEGTKLYVAKIILSLASPVFDTMFQSDFKEKSCDELELPGKKLSDVIEFLRCIYPNTAAEINRDNAMTILPLLEEYQVLQHKPKCEAVLVESVTEETTTDELWQILKHACMYELKTLRARCISLISSRPCDVLDDNFIKAFPSACALSEVLLNANASMQNKLAELEQVTVENELLKKYISSGLLAKKDVNCDPGKKWDNKIITLIDVVPTVNNISEGKQFVIWGVPFKIYLKNAHNRLYCAIQSIGQMDAICDMNGHCILVNRQPNGCGHMVNFEINFVNRNQRNGFIISKLSTAEYLANRLDGKVSVILHLLVTQPYLRKRQTD